MPTEAQTNLVSNRSGNYEHIQDFKKLTYLKDLYQPNEGVKTAPKQVVSREHHFSPLQKNYDF
jgi:hypothetical protein